MFIEEFVEPAHCEKSVARQKFRINVRSQTKRGIRNDLSRGECREFLGESGGRDQRGEGRAKRQEAETLAETLAETPSMNQQ